MPRLLPYCDEQNKPMDPVEWIIRYKDDPADFLHEKMKDREWRLSHLYYIVDADGFKVLFKPNAAQRKLIKDMWFLNVILKSRQHGFSTFVDLFILDSCLWNKDVHTGIIAHTKPDAEAIFDNKVKYPYDCLHEELKKLVTAGTDRAGELKFSNGSSVRVSTSFRSGTLIILHVSEYGKISAQYPDKAREIKAGAIEAVKTGQMIFVESTAEGRDGEFFMLTQRARKLEDTGQPLDKLHWKFHFFAWWEKPDNIADPEKVVITSEYIKYFKDLAARGIKLAAKQKAWYIIKAEALGDDMKREHPSYPDEAFEASIEGAYYGRNIARMRQENRICKVPYLSEYPVYTFWDLGMSDMMAIWFFQKVMGQGRLFDFYQNSGEGLDHYAAVLAKRRYVYATFFFPHDIRARQLGAVGGATGAKTLAQVASGLGMQPQTIVPRPKNPEELANQIEATRHFLAECWIDEEHCDEGIKGLENYRKEWDPKGGTFRKVPLHNWASHPADALRTGGVGFRDAIEYETEELEPEEYYD